MLNGDRITGRILYVQFGYLQLSSAHSGTVSIEWPSIRSIETHYSFRVERFGGRYYVGSIATTSGQQLEIVAGSTQVSMPMSEVYRLIPYDYSFWERVNGSASLGYGYTRSTQTSELTLGFNAFYSEPDFEARLNASAQLTRDAASGTSDQDQIQSYVFFLRPGPNFWGLLGDIDRDPDLGTDGRLVAGPFLGRRLLQAQTAQISAIVGFVYSEDRAADGYGDHGNVEAVIGAEWNVYKFTYPKVSLDSWLLVYPSVTDAPRRRANLNVALTFKVTDRLALKLSENGMYDSRPPVPGARTSDFGISTSLAYEFGDVIR